MKTTAISVTEASRNFADCVNRVHYQDASFVLLKNGFPVACLVPNAEKVCSGRELAKTLAAVRLTDGDSKAWSADLRTARKTLKAPADKWR